MTGRDPTAGDAAGAPAPSGVRTQAAEPRAQVHDLGYKRYVGSRRPQSTRYRVIMRNVVATAWRGWWRMKLWMISAILITAVFGILLYLTSFGIARVLPIPRLLPWSLLAYTYVGFFLSLTVVSTTVARDLRAGAFEFYFARPVRPLDYTLGKLGGAFLVVAVGVAAGQIVLALLQIGLSASDLDAVVDALPSLPRAVAVGVIAALAYTVAPLAFGAVSSVPRNALAAWAAFYVAAGEILVLIGGTSGVPTAVAAIDIKASVMRVGFAIYGDTIPVPGAGWTPARMPLWAAALALTVYTAAGVGAVMWRVTRAERAGMGGG